MMFMLWQHDYVMHEQGHDSIVLLYFSLWFGHSRFVVVYKSVHVMGFPYGLSALSVDTIAYFLTFVSMLLSRSLDLFT